MLHMKVELVWQDGGFCVNYYKVTECFKYDPAKGQDKYHEATELNVGCILCAIDILRADQEPSNWHTCGGEVDGEPGFPLTDSKFSFEVCAVNEEAAC